MENLYVAIISHLHISTCDGMTPKGLKMLKNIGETKKNIILTSIGQQKNISLKGETVSEWKTQQNCGQVYAMPLNIYINVCY